MTHTAGPWHVVYGKRSPDGGAYPRGINAPHTDKPGGIVSVVRWNGIGLPSSPSGQANARLIAAAPDMYMALFDLRVIAEQHITDLAAEAQEGGAYARMEVARWSAVLSALAKAEGVS